MSNREEGKKIPDFHLCVVHCKLYTVHCTLYTVHCNTLHSLYNQIKSKLLAPEYMLIKFKLRIIIFNFKFSFSLNILNNLENV